MVTRIQHLLISYFESYEQSTGLCGAIEVSRIAELALIEVGLEVPQDVLHTRVDL